MTLFISIFINKYIINKIMINSFICSDSCISIWKMKNKYFYNRMHPVWSCKAWFRRQLFSMIGAAEMNKKYTNAHRRYYIYFLKYCSSLGSVRDFYASFASRRTSSRIWRCLSVPWCAAFLRMASWIWSTKILCFDHS